MTVSVNKVKSIANGQQVLRPRISILRSPFSFPIHRLFHHSLVTQDCRQSVSNKALEVKLSLAFVAFVFT